MALQLKTSLAGRVTLLAAVAVGMTVAFVASAGYFTIRYQLYASIDSSLQDRAASAVDSGDLRDIARQAPSWVPGATDVHIRVILPGGSVASSDSAAYTKDAPLFGGPELEVAAGDRTSSTRTMETKYGAFRVAAVPGKQPGEALVLAQSLTPIRDTLGKLGLVLFVFGGLGVLFAAIAGWTIARNGLRPVRRLTSAVEEITRTERLDPIPIDGNDELARLAVAFNQMLTALAASRDRQRQLVADAGHELRTPLTSLRTNLDLLTQAEERGGLSEESRAELFADVRFQIEELTQLIGDLTELARDEGGHVGIEAVDFDEVVERAVDRVRRRAPGLQFDVVLDQWWVVGESAALERAVTNLLDNAAKWSPPGGTVGVQLRQGTLTVTDQGPGIAPDDVPHVFDRFYRSPESRTMPGSGLGLAIVRQAVERHGGTVWVADARPGRTMFVMHIPGSTHLPEVPRGSSPAVSGA